ncbi:DUF2347-containing protein [Aureococcus anophagefferens]|nr:DUF2347-containing protein [Aureococcus anophagefferens]
MWERLSAAARDSFSASPPRDAPDAPPTQPAPKVTAEAIVCLFGVHFHNRRGNEVSWSCASSSAPPAVRRAGFLDGRRRAGDGARRVGGRRERARDAAEALNAAPEGDRPAVYAALEARYRSGDLALDAAPRDDEDDLSVLRGSLGNLAFFYGASVFTLWKAVLLRRRILFYSPVPVGIVCERAHAVSGLLAHSLDPSVASLLAAPEDELLFVNVADLDDLAARRTYVACTSEKVLADKTRAYDVFVDNRRVVVAGDGDARGAPRTPPEDHIPGEDRDEDDDLVFPFLNSVVFGERTRRRHRAFGARRGSVTAPRVVADDDSALALTEGDRLRWRAMRRRMQTRGAAVGGATADLDAVVAALSAANDRVLEGLLVAARTGVDVTTLSSFSFGLHRSDRVPPALADELRVDHPGFKDSATWTSDATRTPSRPPRPPRDSWTATPKRQAPPLP